MTCKQLIKLVVILALAFGACLGLLYITSGTAVQVFEELLPAFLVVATLLVPLSVAMFNYVEAISKELSELRNEVPRSSLAVAIEKLSSLKREILYNGGLIAFLAVLERATKGVAVYLQAHYQGETLVSVIFVSVSLRFAFFCVSLVAAGTQLKGFIVATEFRDIIAKNRK